jgi:hypothetical protein
MAGNDPLTKKSVGMVVVRPTTNAYRPSEAGTLAACEHVRYGEWRLRKIVEERRRPASPRNHQPKILDAQSAKSPTEGSAGDPLFQLKSLVTTSQATA